MSVASPTGLTTRAAETLLVSRAADFLAAGPCDARTLVAHVCQIPAVPEAVATHMAAAMFAEYPRFACGADGRWFVRDATARDLAPPLASIPSAPLVIPSEAAQRPTRDLASRQSGPSAGTPDSSVAPLPRNDRREARTDTLDAMRWVVVDVETTGTRPWQGDRVTEIAAVVVRDGEIAEVFETLVNPQRPIPPWITRLTRITWDMVKDAPVFGDVCDPLLRALEGNVFVAHNARFDWSFVSMEVQRATGRVMDGRQLCTVRLARKLLPQLRSRSLDFVARYYGVEIEPHLRHRAAGDAIATARVLLRLLHDARDRGVERWSHLDLLLAPAAAKKRTRRPTAMPQPVSQDTTA
ncbi:MAG: 3'-5' exonuclease [Gemmatimonadaceae bacterium]